MARSQACCDGRRLCPRAMLLEIDNLTKRFGGLTAVSDVSFGIERGEIVGVFGPNGSGKTTLLNLIASIYPPTSGRIVWNGQEIQGRKPHENAAAGVVKTFQNPQLFVELTAFEHLLIAGHLMLKRRLGWRRVMTLIRRDAGAAGAAVERRAHELIRLCRLQRVSDEPAANLSYGEEKMLGVAMALMCEPELLLAKTGGSARSTTVTWSRANEAGPDPYWAFLIRATNPAGNSKFTILWSGAVCSQCTY
jgi:branched-chain amino acid transport system ATP-binding protein